MVQQAGGHFVTTGAAILFMGGVGVAFAILSRFYEADVFGFIDIYALLSIALMYLGVGGFMVARGRAGEDDD